MKNILGVLCLAPLLIIVGLYQYLTGPVELGDMSKDVPYELIPPAIITALKAKGYGDVNQVARQLNFALPRVSMSEWHLRGAAISIWVLLHISETERQAYALNHAYFGRDCVGITCASKKYFNKPINDLTPEESATLIDIMKAPSKYKDWKHE